MRASSRSKRLSVAFFIYGFLLFTAGALFAQDSTAHDKTGLLGPVIDNFWPVIVTFLTSLTVKIAAKWDTFARAHEAIKWVALYVFALIYNKGAALIGLAGVDPLAPVFALSAVQMTAAALVFKFGSHAVPKVA